MGFGGGGVSGKYAFVLPQKYIYIPVWGGWVIGWLMGGRVLKSI